MQSTITPIPLNRTQAIAHVKSMLMQYFRDQVVEGSEFVLYKDLDDLINDDVRKSYYPTLNKVRKILLNDHGVLTQTVPRRGFKIIPDEQKATLASLTARKKIGSVTTEWRKQHDSIDTSKLKEGKDIDAYTKECIRLSRQEDINAGREDLRIESAMEAVKKKQQAVSSNELKRYLYQANQEMKRLGMG